MPRASNPTPHGLRWQRDDFALPADQLAPALLGHILVRIDEHGTRRAGIIVETEAYLGVHDRASHAYNARRTTRTEPMYAHPGTAYVYFTYGMHHCFNIACAKIDDPAAVLIRALEPIEGLEPMEPANQPNAAERTPPHKLCNGPAKLCRAFGIDRRHTAIDLTTSPELFIARATTTPQARIATSPRIGIGDKGEWSTAPLRYFIEGHPAVSKGPMAHHGPPPMLSPPETNPKRKRGPP
jgi:DNA-3-methyladenine glycosylase